MTWVASVALFAYAGHWLDQSWATSPWLLVVGAVLGTVGGFIHFLSAVAPDMLPFGRDGRAQSDDAPPSDADQDDSR